MILPACNLDDVAISEDRGVELALSIVIEEADAAVVEHQAGVITPETLIKKSLRRNSLVPDEKMWKRLDRFDEIMPGLFLSSINGCSNAENIKNNGITHILMMGSEFKPVFKDTVKQQQVEIKDLPTENLKQYLDSIVEFIDKSLSAGGKVALHCRHSVSRTTSAAIAQLVQKKGMSQEQARDQVRSKRVDSNPNWGFVEQVKQWAQDNKGRGIDQSTKTVTTPVL